jgi:hypothetical protein
MPTKAELGNKIVGFSDEQIAIWHSMIGKKVWKNPSTNTKHEPKPFKSGLKVNTVIGVCVHDHTPHLAFRFAEDASHVECFRCSLAPEDRVNPTTADAVQ